jgi:hypothetical protein
MRAEQKPLIRLDGIIPVRQPLHCTMYSTEGLRYAKVPHNIVIDGKNALLLFRDVQPTLHESDAEMPDGLAVVSWNVQDIFDSMLQNQHLPVLNIVQLQTALFQGYENMMKQIGIEPKRLMVYIIEQIALMVQNSSYAVAGITIQSELYFDSNAALEHVRTRVGDDKHLGEIHYYNKTERERKAIEARRRRFAEELGYDPDAYLVQSQTYPVKYASAHFKSVDRITPDSDFQEVLRRELAE